MIVGFPLEMFTWANITTLCPTNLPAHEWRIHELRSRNPCPSNSHPYTTRKPDPYPSSGAVPMSSNAVAGITAFPRTSSLFPLRF